MITKTGSLLAFAPKLIQGAANTLSNAGSGLWNIGKTLPQAFSNASTTNMVGKDLGKNIFTRGYNNLNSAKNTLGRSLSTDQAQALRTVRNYGAAWGGGTMFGKHVMGPMNQQPQQPQPQQY